jgi:hypothetical protein
MNRSTNCLTLLFICIADSDGDEVFILCRSMLHGMIYSEITA